MSDEHFNQDDVYNTESQEQSAFYNNDESGGSSEVAEPKKGRIRFYAACVLSGIIGLGLITFIVITNIPSLGVGGSSQAEFYNSGQVEYSESSDAESPSSQETEQRNKDLYFEGEEQNSLSPDSFNLSRKKTNYEAEHLPSVNVSDSANLIEGNNRLYKQHPDFSEVTAENSEMLNEINASLNDLIKRIDSLESSVENEDEKPSALMVDNIMKVLLELTNSNAELVSKLKKVEASVATQKKQIDNAQANARLALRRSPAPSPSKPASKSQAAPVAKPKKQVKYVLKAIVQNQAWVQNDEGETLTVSNQGYLPGMGKAVMFDPVNFKLCFDNKKCIGG